LEWAIGGGFDVDQSAQVNIILPPVDIAFVFVRVSFFDTKVR